MVADPLGGEAKETNGMSHIHQRAAVTGGTERESGPRTILKIGCTGREVRVA